MSALLLLTFVNKLELSHIGVFIFIIYTSYSINGTYRARTCDPLLVRQVLSQLSYGPIYLERVKGIEPSQLAWKARTLPLSYTREYW